MGTDPLPNLVDGIGQTSYNYPTNRLATEDGPWAEKAVSYSYQYAGPRSGLTLLQPNASPWTQSCGYDAAGNLAQRTNDFAAAQPLVQTFSITNALNQLTSVTRSGKLTVAGTPTTNASSVTVNRAVESAIRQID